MNPPAPDAQHAERVADTVELLVKVGGLLGMLWAFIARVLRPYHDRRQAALARTILSVMEPALKPFQDDHELLLDIALDNRERHDEINELLDALGFTTDRRSDSDRREAVSEKVMALAERRRERRRRLDA
jgi:hypothetical protein